MITSVPKLSFSYPSSRKLGDIVKLKLLEKLPRRRIIEIWKQNYLDNSWVCSDYITGEQYQCINNNYRHNRNFIIPVRKGANSYYNLFSQFISANIVLLTALERYKQYARISSSNGLVYDFGLSDTGSVGNRNVNAGTPDLVLTLYDELKNSHNLVLLKLDIVNDKDINKNESQLVMRHLLNFYLDFNLFKWVQMFNNNSKNFIFTDYIKDNNNIFNIY